MKHRALRRSLVALPLMALAAMATGQSNEGVKQVERLVKASGNTVKAIADTKLQLRKTMDVYNALMADDTKDRKKLYKSLQKEMDNTEKRRAKIGDEAAKMKTEADSLFAQWAQSTAAIDNADLRNRSEERLSTTKASYAEIETVGQKATDLYGPFMKDLQDQVTFLGHDLNPSAVASLKPEAAKLNEKAETLVKSIDDTIATANRKIAALRPQ
jgi:SMC interacting uncharacterized protein involved in chromosome segregation